MKKKGIIYKQPFLGFPEIALLIILIITIILSLLMGIAKNLGIVEILGTICFSFIFIFIIYLITLFFRLISPYRLKVYTNKTEFKNILFFIKKTYEINEIKEVKKQYRRTIESGQLIIRYNFNIKNEANFKIDLLRKEANKLEKSLNKLGLNIKNE